MSDMHFCPSVSLFFNSVTDVDIVDTYETHYEHHATGNCTLVVLLSALSCDHMSLWDGNNISSG